MSYDVIVIGAGHNGLVAAARLARAGRKVLILERREQPGGMAAKEEIHPGYFVPGLLHDTGLMREGIADALSLSRFGLKLRAPNPIFIPHREGAGISLSSDPQRTAQEIGAYAERDAEAYQKWCSFIGRISGFVSRLLNQPPPSLKPDSTADLLQLGKSSLALRLLGKEVMVDLLRIAPMCAADWLNESFSHQPLKAALSLPALFGAFAGPWSPGTAVNLLFSEAQRGQEIENGPQALTSALVQAGAAEGVEMRLGSEVEEIRVSMGAVGGVRLKSGEAILAKAVLAGCDPKQVFLRLISASVLAVKCEDQFRAIRTRGSQAKMHLALSGAPEIREQKGAIPRLRLAGDHLDDLERAFDPIKYGELPLRPALEVSFPSVSDASLAPKGHHVASIWVSFVPYQPKGGWTEEARALLGSRVIQVLAECAPNVRDLIVGQELLTPTDIESRYGSTQGHPLHGEVALDQLLVMRPTPLTAQYSTPIRGLYLGSSGCHPGGGISCAPGMLAAETLLRS